MSGTISTTHSLERTSPKGEKFVGTCIICGKTGLTMAQVGERCDNPAGVTDDEALLEAISPTIAQACRSIAGRE